MMWRWDTRSAPVGAAQGILWRGRHAFHAHCAVIGPALRSAGQLLIFDTVWAGGGSIGPLRDEPFGIR